MAAWEIHYYENAGGRAPVRDFIDAMPLHAKARTIHTLDLIEGYGLSLGEPHIKRLDEGLWEIRVRALEGYYRLMFTVVGRRVIVLLHGFQKKSHATPQRELDVAKQRLKEVTK
jgi:phage-related protein